MSHGPHLVVLALAAVALALGAGAAVVAVSTLLVVGRQSADASHHRRWVNRCFLGVLAQTAVPVLFLALCAVSYSGVVSYHASRQSAWEWGQLAAIPLGLHLLAALAVRLLASER